MVKKIQIKIFKNTRIYINNIKINIIILMINQIYLRKTIYLFNKSISIK